MSYSLLHRMFGVISRAALACAAAASLFSSLPADAQTISNVPVPANREAYSKLSTSATLFNGEPLIAYKRCATAGCANAQEIAITFCVSSCGTASPVWRDVVINNAPSSIFGDYVATAIARDGTPMIAWVDVSLAGSSPSTVKLARCIDACESASPRYVTHNVTAHSSGALDRIAIVDTGATNAQQAVAFIQVADGQRQLRIATCSTACSSASAAYNVATIDSQTGRTTENPISMTAFDGKPIIAYTDFGGSTTRSELRVARCASACETTSPVYHVSSVFGVTNSRAMNVFPAVGVTSSGDHFIAYQITEPVATDYSVRTKVARCTSGCETASPTYDDTDLVNPTPTTAARRGAASGFITTGGEALAVFHTGQDEPRVLRRVNYTPGSSIPAPSTVDTLPSGSTVAAIFALGRASASLPAYVVYENSSASGVAFKLLSYAGAAGIDTTPNTFTFSDEAGVNLSASITSSAISVSGIDAPSPISVTGGSYSIGCVEPYVTTAGTVSSGDLVCVRHTSSANLATAVSTTLTIGGVSDTFTSTTRTQPADTTPNPFSFTEQFDVPTSTTRTSDIVSINGIDSPASISVTNGSYSIGCTGTYITTPSTINPDRVVCVRHTSAAIPNTRVATVLTVGGVSGTFASTTAAAGGTDTTPDPFAIPTLSGLNTNSLRTSPIVYIRGINAPAPISVSGGEYSINCDGNFTSTAATITNFDGVCVRRVTASTPRTAVSVTLTIGGVTATWYAITAGDSSPPVVTVPSPITYTATVNAPFVSPTIPVAGGSAPYTFIQETVPINGMTFGSDGILRGTPTFVGPAQLEYFVIDANGRTANGRINLNVVAAVASTEVAVPTLGLGGLFALFALIVGAARAARRRVNI